MKLNQLKAYLDRLEGSVCRNPEEVEVVIAIHQPGTLGGTPGVQLTSATLGSDWDKNRLILRGEVPLSSLTKEQFEAILTSVRAGQSWHAYQAQQKLREAIFALIDAILVGGERLTQAIAVAEAAAGPRAIVRQSVGRITSQQKED